MEVIGRYTPHAYALLRIITGLMFMLHGSQKVIGLPGGGPAGKMPIATIPGVGGVIEMVCGFLVAVGLFAGIGAFIASGEMAVAYWAVHARMPGPLPMQNKGELAVLYCFIFLYIAAHGSGIWSLDSILRRRTAAGTTATA